MVISTATRDNHRSDPPGEYSVAASEAIRVSPSRARGELFRRFGLSFCSQNSIAIMLSTNHKPSRRIAAFVVLLAVFLVQGVLAAATAAPLSDAEKIQALIRTVQARKDL